jgi:hypothetical protein
MNCFIHNLRIVYELWIVLKNYGVMLTILYLNLYLKENIESKPKNLWHVTKNMNLTFPLKKVFKPLINEIKDPFSKELVVLLPWLQQSIALWKMPSRRIFLSNKFKEAQQIHAMS